MLNPWSLFIPLKKACEIMCLVSPQEFDITWPVFVALSFFFFPPKGMYIESISIHFSAPPTLQGIYTELKYPEISIMK